MPRCAGYGAGHVCSLKRRKKKQHTFVSTLPHIRTEVLEMENSDLLYLKLEFAISIALKALKKYCITTRLQNSITQTL